MTATRPGEHPGCQYCNWHGWLIKDVAGPVINGKPTHREEVKPCPVCRPAIGARIEAPRDDDAIQRHRRNQDRRMGRTDD